MTRHFWVLVHRYAGLYMALFLIVAGLTGSILAFDGEIRDWLNPPPRVAVRAQTMLDSVTLRESAQALAPQGQLSIDDARLPADEGAAAERASGGTARGSGPLWLSFHREPDEAYVARIEPRTDPATGQSYALPFNTLALDPYTGDEIGRSLRPEGLWPITRQNFISVMVALHYRLAVPGSIGTWLFGIAALIWTLDCFVGFFLTLPTRRHTASLDFLLPIRGKVRMGVEGSGTITVPPPSPPSLSEGEGVEPRRSWWQRWKPAWLVKWRGSAFCINFDLHRASGLWFWLILLVLAWSSVGFNLGEQVYMPAMKAAFNMPDPYGDLPTLETPIEEPRLPWREAHAIGQRLMAEQAGIHGFRVQREEALYYGPEQGVFFYYVHSDRDVADEGGGTWLVFNGNSGQFAGLNLPSGLNAGSTLHSWIFALHVASIWGLPYKIFLCVTGLVIGVLSVTGIVIWLRKRWAERLRRDRSRQPGVPSSLEPAGSV